MQGRSIHEGFDNKNIGNKDFQNAYEIVSEFGNNDDAYNYSKKEDSGNLGDEEVWRRGNKKDFERCILLASTKGAVMKHSPRTQGNIMGVERSFISSLSFLLLH